MGILDRSKSITTQESYTEETQRNVAIQDSAGAIAIADNSGNVSFLTTDFNAVDRATGLAEMTVAASERLGLAGLDVGMRNAEIISDSSAGFLQRGLDFARETNTRFQSTIASTVDAIQRIGVEQNKSTDQRLSEVSERTVKYALLALGVLGLALVGFAAYKR